MAKLRIVALNGGVGTGKTRTIQDLIFRVVRETFMPIRSILVCCRDDISMDQMATIVLNNIENSDQYQIRCRHIIEEIPNHFGNT